MARPLHGREALPPDFSERVRRHIDDRIAQAPLGRTASPQTMASALEGAISSDGLGVDGAWRLYLDHVEPNTIGLDSERFLAFIPVSPSAAGVWMDAMAGAATFSAESWLEASGVVAAENQALRWLADAAGLPATAGGCFMSGGSIGNLSALAVARECGGDRTVVAVGDTAHASVDNALALLAMRETIVVPTGPDGRMTGAALTAALAAHPERAERVGVVIAAGGSTNAGVVDDLEGLADVCGRLGAWLHVDAAYGGAALLAPSVRHLFAGIERADSVIIDPHKWLFAPEGSCALLYRTPELASRVHTQHGPYVDVLHADPAAWNPSDYGFQLTRRATGLPLWFQLVTHGTDALVAAIESGISLARRAAEALAAVRGVSLVMQPDLGVVLFRREGWGRDEWRAWARRLLDDGVAFVAPSTWKGEAVGRLVFMHPRTPASIIDEITASLR